MRSIIIAGDVDLNVGVANLGAIKSLGAGSISVFKDTGAMFTGAGGESMAGVTGIQFFIGRTPEEVKKQPNVDVKSFNYEVSAGAVAVNYIKYIGDNGTTTTNSLAGWLGATPIAGEEMTLQCSDPKLNYLEGFNVSYSVQPEDASLSDVIDGIVAQWNGDVDAKQYAVASKVGSTTSLGLKLTGLDGKNLKITPTNDLYPARAAVIGNDTKFVKAVNSYEDLLTEEDELSTEDGRTDTYRHVPGMFTVGSKVVLGTTYDVYLCTWYNGDNRLQENLRDKQTLTIAVPNGADQQAKLVNILADIKGA